MKERNVPQSHISVIGMGYVGTSLAAVLAETGCRVWGIDIDPETIETINQGCCPIKEKKITEVFEKHTANGRITATKSFDKIDNTEVTIVTVGTPLEKADPDLSAVESATRSIGPHVSQGDIVIFRSTLPAGATEETLVPILNDQSELKAGEDCSVAFCPERMAEGSAYHDLTTLPVVVGGLTDNCRERTEMFWNELGQDTVSVSTPTAAELTKLADNWWIDLNIALANELALLAEQLDVDVLEIIHAANTLPKGEYNVNILFPGAGVGGSCLVKDPWFVADLGDSYGLDLQTPRISREVNEQMPNHVVGLVKGALGGLQDAQIAVLGYAFKGDTDDTRNTPAKPIVEHLRRQDAKVSLTDPQVPSSVIQNEMGMTPDSLSKVLPSTDAVVIVTGHDQYQKMTVRELQSAVGKDEFVVVDGRHVFDPEDFHGSSIEYLGVGRGKHE